MILQECISWCVRSENNLKQCLPQVFQKIGREVLLPVVPCAHRAQPSTLTLRASMPCGALRVPGQGSSRMCPSTSGVVINNGDDILQHGCANPAGRPPSSMAWSRALRATDLASRISPLSFDGDKRGRMRQFYDAVVLNQRVFFGQWYPSKSMSAGMIFQSEQREASFLLSIGAKTQHWR